MKKLPESQDNEQVEQPQFKFILKTWGGFYNKDHREIHKFEEGTFLFDTEEERNTYVEHLKEIEQRLNASVLMTSFSQGFHVQIETVAHRIVEYKGKTYYSRRVMGYGYPYHAVVYYMEDKWYPGFNDWTVEEAIGEDVDYEQLKILQEWVTGAFDVKEE